MVALVAVLGKGGRIQRSTVLTLVRFGHVMLDQQLVLELLVSAWLLRRMRKSKSLGIPRRSSVSRGVGRDGIAPRGLPSSACGSGGESRSLRRLPDAMIRMAGRSGTMRVRVAVVDVRLARSVYERVDGGDVGALLGIVMRVKAHAEAGFRAMVIRAHDGLRIGVKGHAYSEGRCTHRG